MIGASKIPFGRTTRLFKFCWLYKDKVYELFRTKVSKKFKLFQMHLSYHLSIIIEVIFMNMIVEALNGTNSSSSQGYLQLLNATTGNEAI